TGFVFSAIPTFINVVPTGLHIDQTPTPVPVITLPPPTPTPAPTPTAPPGATPKPTVKPTVKPSPTPSPPTARFTFTACPAGGGLVNFNASTSTAGPAGGTLTYAWNFDDGGTGTGVS